MSWQLVPRGWEPDPEPGWMQEQSAEVKACPGHLWELVLEDENVVYLRCELCPASIDDLYPDGHELIFYEAGELSIESGQHNLANDQIPTPIRVPVTARVHSSTNYWGEVDVELLIEPRTEA